MSKAVMAERIAETDLHGRGIKQESLWIWSHFIPGHSGYSGNNNKMYIEGPCLMHSLSRHLFVCMPTTCQEYCWVGSDSREK